MIGSNFTCGRGSSGDVSFLRRVGTHYGFAVHALDLVETASRRCSSTAVRRALAAGDVATARDLLGRDDPRILGRVAS